MMQDVDAYLGEAFRDPRRVGVGDLAEEQFGPDPYDPRLHRASTRWRVVRKYSAPVSTVRATAAKTAARRTGCQEAPSGSR